jgi:GNAT superfamily N-acetyltransferase
MIRRVRADDVDVYRAIRLSALKDSPAAFGSTYAAEVGRPQSAWCERVRSGSSGDERAIFLAFASGECIGLAGCVEDDLGADKQLVSMWVAPAHRGTGVATELIEAVLDWARGTGARSVGLWVTRGNDRAHALYARHGFEVTGDVQPLPSDPCKDEIRMVRAC